MRGCLLSQQSQLISNDINISNDIMGTASWGHAWTEEARRSQGLLNMMGVCSGFE